MYTCQSQSPNSSHHLLHPPLLSPLGVHMFECLVFKNKETRHSRSKVMLEDAGKNGFWDTGKFSCTLVSSLLVCWCLMLLIGRHSVESKLNIYIHTERYGIDLTPHYRYQECSLKSRFWWGDRQGILGQGIPRERRHHKGRGENKT